MTAEPHYLPLYIGIPLIVLCVAVMACAWIFISWISSGRW